MSKGGVMNTIRLFNFASVLTVALVLGACTPHKIYRSNFTDVCNVAERDSECLDNALQVYETDVDKDSEYFLGFVEFDDQGQLWDRSQMHAVIRAIKEVAAKGVKAVAEARKVSAADGTAPGTSDVIMVVFVHGWQHSAKPGDKNIQHFRELLRQVSALESQFPRGLGQPARPVVGVYLGWRGRSLDVPYISDLTFWDRKDTAQKVGRGGVTEVLERLELIKLDKNAALAEKTRQRRISACLEEKPASQSCLENALKDNARKSRTNLIVIGHSFGGAVVYSAVSQVLKDRYLPVNSGAGNPASGNKTNEDIVDGFGDLVVLLNPAFEANLYSTLENMSSEKRSYSPQQRPVLAILTSETDRATGTAFPLGRWVSTIFETEREVSTVDPVAPDKKRMIDQGEANRQTVGHFEPYTTHVLSPYAPSVTAAATTGSAGTSPTTAKIEKSLELFRCAYKNWKNDRVGGKIYFKGTVLEHLNKSVGRNPYLVIRVKKELIPDHNEIWDDRVTDFLLGLVFLSNYEPRGEVKCPSTE